MNVALRTEHLSKSWGALKANDDVTFTLARGARHAVIGPNGAGKTTFVNLLTGALAPTSGDVYLGADERITHLPQHARVRKGMTRTYQVTALFPELTVLESVVLAVCERKRLARAWYRTVASCTAEADESRRLLASLHLEGDADQLTRTLPYGKRRLLDIALALATRPKILLLDEPGAGIPAGERAQVFDVLARLPDDVTLLFIDHDMELVFRFAQRISVLVSGRLLAEGTPDQIAADGRVREIYLGEAERPQDA
jgi:branched-chain amino acid transport system ATP-binding protein